MQKPIRLEVTGTDSPHVSPRAPLWILEGKAQYADAHPEEDVYIVHVLNAPGLARPVVRAIRACGLAARYPVEVKRPYGAPERYLVIPASAPEVIREDVFFRWLAQQTLADGELPFSEALLDPERRMADNGASRLSEPQPPNARYTQQRLPLTMEA
ncbi:hypothetical protein D3C86_287870 [compost metagenome]